MRIGEQLRLLLFASNHAFFQFLFSPLSFGKFWEERLLEKNLARSICDDAAETTGNPHANAFAVARRLAPTTFHDGIDAYKTFVQT